MSQPAVPACLRSEGAAALSRRHLLKGAAAAALTANLSLSSLIARAAPEPTTTVSLQVMDAESVRNVITPDAPITFDNSQDQIRHIPVFGSAVQVTGDVQIDLTIQSRLNDGAPSHGSNGIIFQNTMTGADDRRSLYIVYQNGAWSIGYQKGNDQGTFSRIFTSTDSQGSFTLRIDASGQMVTVVLPDGSTKQQQLPESLYVAQNAMNLAVQIAPHSTVTVSQMVISPSFAFPPVSGGSTLRALADQRGMFIGSTSQEFNLANDPRYNGFVSRDFNLLIASGESLWNQIRPARDQYNFVPADLTMNYAKKNGMRMRNYIIWQYAPDLPGWLTSGNFSRDDLLTIMAEYINTVVPRYPSIEEWIVVNEAFTSNGGLRPGFWYRGIGADYIEQAFRLTRQASPNAVLLYNDDHSEIAARVDGMAIEEEIGCFSTMMTIARLPVHNRTRCTTC